jgi:hypothetical protein
LGSGKLTDDPDAPADILAEKEAPEEEEAKERGLER